MHVLECSVAAHAASPPLGDRLNWLGLALQDRYRATRDSTDLDRAIDAFRRAADLLPGAAGPHVRCNLSDALVLRFERDNREADLLEALALARAGNAGTGREHPNYATYRNALGNALRTSFDVTGRADELNEAIDCYREAVQTTSPMDGRSAHSPTTWPARTCSGPLGSAPAATGRRRSRCWSGWLARTSPDRTGGWPARWPSLC